MANELSNIPAPSQDARLALLRAGSGNNRLVYSSGKWRVIRVENVKSTDITAQQWDAQKKIDNAAANKPVDVSGNAGSYQSKKAAEKDPLGIAVTTYGLVADITDGVVKGKDGIPFYIYTNPGGNISIHDSWAKARKQIISDYQTLPGGTERLFKLLYDKKLIDQKTFESKDYSSVDFDKGLRYAINRAGVDALDKRDISGKLGTPTLDKFLSGSGIPSTSTGGGPKTGTERRETTRPDADEEANEFFIANLGRAATKQEKDAYFTALNAAEKKAVVKRTVTDGNVVETGSLLETTDKALILGRIAGDALAGTDLEVLAKSGAGVAQDINNLKTYANQYGITLSDEQAMGYVADNLKSGKDLQSKKAKIQKLAKIKYSNIADQIDDDTSVMDIASETMYKISSLTGMPLRSISINSEIVQKALANNGKPGVMPDYEVGLLVRTSPETKQKWLNSPAAREEAAGYANNILKTFGLIG